MASEGTLRFVVFPAIDLRGGQVVRLRQGDPKAQTVFDDDPVAVAQQWVAQGAEWLHVVNLDGALESKAADGSGGIPLNLRRLAAIRDAVRVPIQFGGGIRSTSGIRKVLDLGATRVVLGTVAVHDPGLVAEALKVFGTGRIVAGLDARDGYVATHGWQSTSSLPVLTVALAMKELGVLRVVYTDISRDGMLSGANIRATAALAAASGLRVIASGGVAGLDDIRALAQSQDKGVEGVIAGQALYTGALSLPEAIATAGSNGPQAGQGERD